MHRSPENIGARILAFQVFFGVIASGLVRGGVIDGDALLAAFKVAGAIAALFTVGAMSEKKGLDLAVATSSLSVVLAILSLLTALPSFVFTGAAVISLATAVLAARLARHDWAVGNEPFLFTLCRTLPVLGLFGPVLDIILCNSKESPRKRWGR